MSFHKDLRGDDLHPARIYTRSGTPVGTQTPEFIEQTVIDTDTNTIYLSTGLTNLDWEIVGGSGDITTISGLSDVNNIDKVDESLLVWSESLQEHVYLPTSSIGTKIHNNLTGLDTGDYQHLTQAEHDNLTSVKPQFDSLQIGDVDGGNYVEFDTQGNPRLFGEATTWEDLRVPVTGTTANGSNPPTYSLFANDGLASPGATKALGFLSNSSGVGTIPHITGYNIFEAAHTIEFWFRPKAGSTPFNDIVAKGTSTFNISWWGGSDVYVAYGGMGSTSSTVSLNVGNWNHILVRFTPGGTNTTEIFVNGSAAGTISSGGGPTNNSSDIVINADTIIFDIDELAIWNKTLSNGEVAARYNSGAGAGLIGSELNLVGLWKFEESSGSVFPDATTTANNGSLTGTVNTDFEWIDGHVGAPDIGSLGVVLPFFSSSTRNELYFTVQLPHGWKEGTNIEPHIHWAPITSGGVGERVVWGIEYSWASVGETFGNTTIITGGNNLADEDLVEYKHTITDMGPIDATGKTLSSMLVCRVFRDALNADDDYGDFAALLEIDFHYQVDAFGSEEEYTKG